MKNSSNKGKIIIIIILAVLVLIAGGVLVGYRYYLNKLESPNTSEQEIAFTIEEGESMNKVLNKLYEEGLIQDVDMAKLYVKLNKKNNYYAGNFILKSNMSVQEIIAVITNVENATKTQVTLTITPGNWARDVADKIAAITNLEAQDILDKWNDPAYIEALIAKYEFLTEDIWLSKHCYLEGYFMPETYYIYETTTIEQVTERILNQTKVFYQENKDLFAASELSIHEVFTLASIVNFEAKTLSDMQKVASVFYNRLAKGMLLQSSATVCYAYYQNVSWSDCEKKVYVAETKNEYNTYIYAGLPVGPICNPSAQAISATLNPAETDYYYFIGNLDTGECIFAKTLEEHNKNVKKYLKGRY